MMAPIGEPSRPIIVCGMPRTGTTLIGQFLKTAGWDVLVVMPEFPPMQVPSMFDVLDQTRALFRSQTWRPFTDDDIDARVCELFRRIIGSGRDPEPMGDDIGQPRFGFKQPRAEMFHDRFAEALRSYRPQYVYTFRDPDEAFSSFNAISHGAVDPREWGQWLTASSVAASALASRGDLFPVDVARWSGDPSLRAGVSRRMFEFLDLPYRDESRAFCESWPAVNRRTTDIDGSDTPGFDRSATEAAAGYRKSTVALPIP